jgi:hypothetical protein
MEMVYYNQPQVINVENLKYFVDYVQRGTSQSKKGARLVLKEHTKVAMVTMLVLPVQLGQLLAVRPEL